MKCFFGVVSIVVFSILSCNGAERDSINWGIFGKIHIYWPKTEPTAMVLFISGDSGWDRSVANMSKHATSEGAIVIGINIRTYYANLRKSKSSCFYPAGDLEELSLSLQRKYKVKQYLKPILVGYSAGATLVYGALVQAPANTFKGVIALSFSPDIESVKPLCAGSGLKWHVLTPGKLYYLEASQKLRAPFIVLQGINDQVCPYKTVMEYLKNMSDAELITLPNVGHGFSVHPNWSPQFVAAFNKILAAPSFAQQNEKQNVLLKVQPTAPLPGDLPITVIPASLKENYPVAFFISGDGGWTSFDQSVAEQLASIGIPVIGFDSQKYFWDEKTPEETAADMNKAVKHYMQQWNRKSFLLVGYSFGADIVPFLANRIAPALKDAYKGVFMLSPDAKGDFEIHISDMLDMGISNNKYDIVQEVKNCKSPKPVCIFGNQEDQSEIIYFKQTGAKVVLVPGSHHYNNNYKGVADIISENISE
jgi:type IV secretory pathway VirJ component